eukprot:8900274-Alexandrium_andersonii.AAC.1
MSASLVGSEMCIRDRCFALLRAKVLSGIAVFVHYAALARCACFAQSRTCLLYTSDAADDM